MRARVAGALLVAVIAALLVSAAMRPSLRLQPDSATWRHSLRGVTSKGLLVERGGLLLPGLPRAAPAELRVEVEPAARGAQSLGVRVDGGASVSLRAGAAETPSLALPPAPGDGLRLDFEAEGGPLRLLSLELVPGARPLTWPLVAGLAAALLMAWRARPGRARGAFGLALVAGALIALAAFFPLGAWLWPQSLPALVPALLALGLGLTLAWQAERRRGLADAALIAAFVFGAAVRLLFLYSTGSWDTEYWRTWMHAGVEHGLTGVYGPADATPPGHVVAQLRGQEELWKPERGGRAYVIDYPPLALALWVLSSHAATRVAPDLPAFERDNVAVRLPALLGDLLALGVLAWAWAPDRRRGLRLAALYWALPISWLNSATLGYFDGALAPLAVAALVLAGRGRAGWAGAWLVLATLVKPTALIAAPAVAVALALHAGHQTKENRARAIVTAFGRATLGGLAVALVVLLPFAWAGTLNTAFVHCARLFFQERLSGGYPNPWWLLGHALTAGASGTWLGPVAFAPLGLLPFPARPVGSLLFALGAFHVLRRQLPGARAACLAGSLLFLLYGFVAVGVHENHPHPLFLMLLAAGLPTRRLRWIATGAAVVYLGDMLALSALGRYHGGRYLWLLPWTQAVDGWRMAAGFDLTLPLVLVHLAVFIAASVRVAGDMRDVTTREVA